MAKIGTAHIEIKPVIDEAALTVITDRIAEAVAAGVQRGMRGSSSVSLSGSVVAVDPESAAKMARAIRERDWSPCEHKAHRGSCRECRAL